MEFILKQSWVDKKMGKIWEELGKETEYYQNIVCVRTLKS